MHRPLLSRSHPSPAFPSLLGAKSPSLVANSDFKTDSEIEIVKLYVMVPPPLANLAAEGMYSQLVSEDADLAEDLQSAQEGSMVNFIKALLFRRDIQDQIHLVACMTVREWEAGQRALLSARWLAVSKKSVTFPPALASYRGEPLHIVGGHRSPENYSWSTVAVCQICLDEITRLKEQLITDSSVRVS
ncbi:hypothetical protein GQ53DRAFT_339202 [Thozetella sp. PMI_491]|nr:hypothetical protein GQ53DRAFT_339202 [Thozetella sp. PMI_491]